ncbi:MAG: hypothetical protein OEY29_14010 [Gammaproteobacteria bacterium]|nr:hypothetical protein [Gammaproteobacteria bacterium]
MNIDSEKARVKSFVDRGNFHAALNIALSAVNESRRNNDQPGVDTFLRVIQDIVEELTAQFGSKS